MLDGRVLGASRVEYKPFGKPPLKREDRVTAELASGLSSLHRKIIQIREAERWCY